MHSDQCYIYLHDINIYRDYIYCEYPYINMEIYTTKSVSKQSVITRLHTFEHGTLDYDPSVPCIIASHFGFATDEEFKNMLNLGLSLSIEKRKDHGKLGWLADTTQMDGNAMTEWAIAEWNPKMIAEGIRHVAFVASNDVFAAQQIRDYAALCSKDGKMKTASFQDIESAKAWLREVL